MPFKLLHALNTTYCADTVEWCPMVQFNKFFACGTYELQNEQTKSTRIGQLHLFSVDEQLQINLHSTIDTSAILDMKWFSKLINGRILLATCNADGKVMLWEFVQGHTDHLTYLSEHQINSENVISLSIDKSDLTTPQICVSDSQGFLTVLRLDDKNDFHLLHKVKVNDYEAWIATFSLTNDSVVLTGGDDCFIKVFDLRCHSHAVNKLEEHQCGVTSLRFNHKNTNILASGSYDETIKIWDDRIMKNSLSSCGVGGGVWRIKWSPVNAKHILTAAMYSGVYELEYSPETHSLRQENEFKEHESITYGADYCYIPPNELLENYLKDEPYLDCDGMLTVTCSFYDKKLCLCAL